MIDPGFLAAGLTLDDLDLDLPDDLPALPLDRPRHRRRTEWWTTTEAEDHFFDFPDFQSGQERVRYMVGEMGRAALTGIDGATADDPIFPHGRAMVSLNHLLALVGRDAVDDVLDHLEPG